MKFEKRIVVFLDILGFAALVESAAREPEGDTAGRLNAALTTIQNLKLHLDDAVAPGTKLSNNHQPKLNIQIFSDSVILSILPDSESVEGLFEMLSKLFINLMAQGVYIRGGIAFDQIFANEDSPCGPGVNKSYQLESEIADFPRIVLGKSVVDYCRLSAPNILDSALVERNDEDGVYSLEPIKHATVNLDSDPYGILSLASTIAAYLNHNLKSIVDHPRIFEK
ncbi:MAG: hypothetical protein ABJP34_10610 [Erythrobacter sp.]